jgi:hypothetical protein
VYAKICIYVTLSRQRDGWPGDRVDPPGTTRSAVGRLAGASDSPDSRPRANKPPRGAASVHITHDTLSPMSLHMTPLVLQLQQSS